LQPGLKRCIFFMVSGLTAVWSSCSLRAARPNKYHPPLFTLIILNVAHTQKRLVM
jgi:hypothetical protein